MKDWGRPVKSLVAVLSACLLVVALAACTLGGNDPAKGGGNSGNSGESGNSGNSGNSGSQGGLPSGGGNDGNQGGNTPAPAPKTPEVVTFNDVFFAPDGTVYVGMPDAFPFLEMQGVGDARITWLDIPGTVHVPAADYFAVYDGMVYFTEFIHPSDAAARLTPLYVAKLDGTGVRQVLSDVAASTAPVIVDGVLYYQSFDLDEGQKRYTSEGANGGTITTGDAEKCMSVVRSYDLTTGKTASMDVTRTIAATFVGATTERLYFATEYLDTYSNCFSVALDFTDRRDFTVPGYPIAVDAAGHIISRSLEHTRYIHFVCDGNGASQKDVSTIAYGAKFNQDRYLIYEDDNGDVVVFDTVKMAQVKKVTLGSNISTRRLFYYYNPTEDLVYFLGPHRTIPGIYQGWDGNDLSAFTVDMASGQVRRILPYTDVLWRRTGTDWQSKGAYVLQWSELDFYSYEQLSTLSNEELFYGRNEMFWAHGMDFNGKLTDNDLQAFFSAKTWPRELTGNPLSDAEKWNFELIQQIETERNSPYKDRGYTMEHLKQML